MKRPEKYNHQHKWAARLTAAIELGASQKRERAGDALVSGPSLSMGCEIPPPPRVARGTSSSLIYDEALEAEKELVVDILVDRFLDDLIRQCG